MVRVSQWSGLAFVCVLAVAVQGCAVQSTNQVMKPGESKSGFMGLSKTADVTVDQPKVLKKQTGKVAVGSFKVGFLVDNKASATSGSPIGSKGHATGYASLEGLTPEKMQQITNEIYQQFVQELKDKGYTVMGQDELVNEPAYTALQDAGVASPEDNVVVNLALTGKTTYVAPDGMKLVYYIGEKKAAFALSTETIKKAQLLSEKTGANVLAVNYLVNFIAADARGFYSANLKIGQGLAIVPGSSVTVYSNQKIATANLRLGQAVWSDQEFATIENVSSKAGKAIGAVTNVATALLGGGTRQSEHYNMTIDPDKYAAGVKDIGTQANQKLIARLAQDNPNAVAVQEAIPVETGTAVVTPEASPTETAPVETPPQQ